MQKELGLDQTTNENSFIKSPLKNDNDASTSAIGQESPQQKNFENPNQQFELLGKCVLDMANTLHPIIGNSLIKLQEGYETVIATLVERFA